LSRISWLTFFPELCIQKTFGFIGKTFLCIIFNSFFAHFNFQQISNTEFQRLGKTDWYSTWAATLFSLPNHPKTKAVFSHWPKGNFSRFVGKSNLHFWDFKIPQKQLQSIKSINIEDKVLDDKVLQCSQWRSGLILQRQPIEDQ